MRSQLLDGEGVYRVRFFASYTNRVAVYEQAIGRVERVEVKASVTVYGATCKRCNEHNPHAEARADFVCYGCRANG